MAQLAIKEENDRLVALYESVVSRTALLEQTITKVALHEERMRHIGADHAKLTKLYEDANSRREETERQLRLIGGRSADVELRWNALRADLLESEHRSVDENLAVASLINRMRVMGDEVTENYRLAAAERDILRQETRQLRETIQGLTRSNSPEKPFPNLPTEPASYLPLHLIDVGSQPLASEDHVYAALKRTGACLITGFEALPDKNPPSEPNVRMLNMIVGAGGPAVFHVAHFDPTSSLMEPNLPFLRQFMALAEMCKVVSEFPVETTLLDNIPEITDCDFLKLDIQGGELDVLRGANRLLEHTIVVHTEVEFSQVYRDQPLFSEIDTHLRAKGFELIDLIKFGHNTYAELPSRRTASRLLWSDAIYFRSIDAMSALGAQKLMRAAFIAHVNYGMWDLAAHILARYDSKYGSKLAAEYVAAIERT